MIGIASVVLSLGERGGGEPLFRDLTDGFAIASSAGLEVVHVMDDDQQSYAWSVRFPTQALARLVIDALPMDITTRPDEFGLEAL